MPIELTSKCLFSIDRPESWTRNGLDERLWKSYKKTRRKCLRRNERRGRPLKNYKSKKKKSWKVFTTETLRKDRLPQHCNTKMSLILEPSLYELNSIKIACKCVPLIKPKTIPIVFIWLKEGPLWPTSVHAQGPQLFVSKPKWHAPSIVVKKYYGAWDK